MRMPFAIFSPVAARPISCGVDLSMVLVNVSAEMHGLDARAPPPLLATACVTPQDHDNTSISPLCRSSVDSPWILSSLRNQSAAADGPETVNAKQAAVAASTWLAR